MPDNKVMHGALALIYDAKGQQIGRIRNIRWSETFADQEVRGLGTLFVVEAPVVSHSANGSMDFYEITFKDTGIPGSIRRDVQTKQQFETQMLLRDPFALHIFKRLEDAVDPQTGLKTEKATPYAIIPDALINSEGADVSEGSISGHNVSFRYLSPVIYPPA